MDKKYASHMGEKKCAILDKQFYFSKKKPQVDSNSWSEVYKPDTLITKQSRYSIKSIDTNNF